MKKLDKLILKSFIGPLVLTFTISVFVLLMQFVWKYIDDMVGKGLEFGVIAELLLYASATFVPMALPIAVLFASIMTMGNFGEKYELVAMKAGGISIRRVMMPLVFVSMMLTGVAFYFANNVMPLAMLKYKSTLYDITRKKPAVNIRPSEYYSEIEGYVIRVNDKDPDGRTLHDITIYDHKNGIDNTNIIVAKSGLMHASPDDRYLLFSLYDGYTYSEPSMGEDYVKRPFTRIGFSEQVLTFDISSFAFEKTDEEFYKGNYQMMNVRQIDTTVRHLKGLYDTRSNEFVQSLLYRTPCYRTYFNYQEVIPDTVQMVDVTEYLDTVQPDQREAILTFARNSIQATANDAHMFSDLLYNDREFINRHYVEWQRKFTLSIACLLLFLIGAPFGSIVRKGGLGMPLVASVGFFVLYYVIGMISEKAVREGVVGPVGMWISSFVFLPIGIVLTLSATTDSPIFDAVAWKKFFRKLNPRCK